MGTFGLAWRNLARSFSRRWPVIVILAVSVAALEVGNTLLENSSDGLRRTYTSSFTGDWTVSARGRESFTLFGSDLPLIGEYYVLPTISNATELIASLRSQKGVSGVTGQVTAAGLLSLDSWAKPVPVFGVSFGEYFSLFPALKLLKGSLEPGAGRILINEAQLDSITKTLGREPRLGESLTLTIFNDHSFTIRPVTLTGVFRYPTRDEVLDRIVLTDPDTARALNGYVYGSPGAGTAVGTSQDDLNALFSDAHDSSVSVGGGVKQSDIEDRLKDTKARDAANRVLEGSWNFLLVKGAQPRGISKEFSVRDWKSSAGGNALITWLVQLVFNVSMGFVLAGAAVISINSLALSVSERSRELGTMRALGAGRLRVSALIATEAMLTVTGAALIGVAFGLVILAVLHSLGIPLDNPYLQGLFGSRLLKPTATWGGTAEHIGLAVVLGLVSFLQPVRLVLRIQPVQAMARGN